MNSVLVGEEHQPRREKLDSLLNIATDPDLARQDRAHMHLAIGDLYSMTFDIPKAYFREEAGYFFDLEMEH